jgi:hypothetical protein
MPTFGSFARAARADGYSQRSRRREVCGESPFSDGDYPITFHVRTEPLPASLTKRPRRGPSALVFLVIALLTLLGLASLASWLAKLLA